MIAEPKRQPEVAYWSVAKRILFRCFFCYLAFYLLPSPGLVGLLGFIPGSSVVSRFIENGWMKSLPWIATHILRMSGPTVAVYRQSGTGDKTLDYVMHLVFL